MEDCLFSDPLSYRCAEEIWETRKAVVENLPREEAFTTRKLALSAAALKAARKFRSWHSNANSVVDFIKLNPMDLVVHQLWISRTIAESYQDKVTPDRWLYTALLDPPTNSIELAARRRNGFVRPSTLRMFSGWSLEPEGHLRVSEAEAFVTVALHGDRAFLLSGFHRTFACAQGTLAAANAPRGVLLGVSNSLAAMGDEADEILRMMQKPRPPRMADCDDRLFLPVTVRRRQYPMKVRCEVVEGEEEEAQTTSAKTLDTSPDTERFVLIRQCPAILLGWADR